MNSNWQEEYNVCSTMIWRMENPEKANATRRKKYAETNHDCETRLPFEEKLRQSREEVLKAIDFVAEATTLALTAINVHRILCRRSPKSLKHVRDIMNDLVEEGVLERTGRYCRTGTHDHAIIFKKVN